MQKVILDTNVIVSALISNSVPTKILYELVLTKTVQPCLTNDILEEYVEVLNRDKFSKFANFKNKAEIVLTKLKEISLFYKPNKKVNILKDASDNKFLELASVSSAHYLVTGNNLDFTITEFEKTRIVTPREYWDLYNQNE